jgi:Cu2+-exporting ATPase
LRPAGTSSPTLFNERRSAGEATKLSVIVFGKTGTLTLGQPRVVEIIPASDACQS